MSVTSPEEVQASFAATLVDEWVRRGVTDAVICPGSRSTPLALALFAHRGVELHVRLDERSAGFFALGLGLGSGRPAVVCTTSGTAAVELHPAVVEAHHAGVPLIVCTADRPPELHGVGAPQAIDQVHLFGRAVRWFANPGVAHGAARHGWRPLAARAHAEATTGSEGPGPVHLNLAFREPLVAFAEPVPSAPIGVPAPWGRGDPAVAPRMLAGWAGRRGVIVAGAGCGPPTDVLGLAAGLGWPVVADPRSRCRTSHRCVVAAADAILRDPVNARALLPEVVVMIGSPWVSKAVASWVRAAAEAGAEVTVIDPSWRWRDPDHVVGAVSPLELSAMVASLSGSQLVDFAPLEPGYWLVRWEKVEQAAQRALDHAFRQERQRSGGELSEPGIARNLASFLLPGVRVLVSSSMPVRDLESFGPALDRPHEVFSNRGASGIDGVCSTAMGLAAHGGPVVAVVGDLTFFHDVSAFVRPPGARGRTSCTFIVVDNAGGGIFSFLPQATLLDDGPFERLFATPQLPKVTEIALGFGADVADVGDEAGLASALARFVGKAELAVVRAAVPSRAENVTIHQRIFDTVAAAVREVAALD